MEEYLLAVCHMTNFDNILTSATNKDKKKQGTEHWHSISTEFYTPGKMNIINKPSWPLPMLALPP